MMPYHSSPATGCIQQLDGLTMHAAGSQPAQLCLLHPAAPGIVQLFQRHRTQQLHSTVAHPGHASCIDHPSNFLHTPVPSKLSCSQQLELAGLCPSGGTEAGSHGALSLSTTVVVVSGSFKNFFPKGSKPSGAGSSTKRAAEKAAGAHVEASGSVLCRFLDGWGALRGLASPVC